MKSEKMRELTDSEMEAVVGGIDTSAYEPKKATAFTQAKIVLNNPNGDVVLPAGQEQGQTTRFLTRAVNGAAAEDDSSRL